MAFTLRAHFVRPNGIPPFCKKHSDGYVTINQDILGHHPCRIRFLIYPTDSQIAGILLKCKKSTKKRYAWLRCFNIGDTVTPKILSGVLLL
jgi:hypothetical protein